MSKEKFRFKDYWELFKLSCRPYIYPMPLEKNFRCFIAGYLFFGLLIGIILSLLPFNFESL